VPSPKRAASGAFWTKAEADFQVKLLYKHFSRTISVRALENQALKSDILVLYSKSKKRMGAYKIRQRLLVEYSKRVSVGKVYRLMKSMTLPKMSTVKPKSHYQKGGEENLKNLLNKEFNPKSPNQVWVSDITYVKVSSQFVYICAIMDLFSRKILAYKVSVAINTRLVLGTFRLAYSKRRYPKSVMFHSDRGTQYTAKEFRKAIDEADFVQSFSAKGHPFDNAVIESFFRYLKHKELNRRTLNTVQELSLSLYEYVEGFYNKNRPHSANTTYRHWLEKPIC